MEEALKKAMRMCSECSKTKVMPMEAISAFSGLYAELEKGGDVTDELWAVVNDPLVRRSMLMAFCQLMLLTVQS